MKIAVVGTGYVGLVTGACLAHLGQRVTCMDRDAGRIEALRQGRIPIHEEGLEELLRPAVERGRLDFTTHLPEAARGRHLLLVAVGTPPGADGSADLAQVKSVLEEIARLPGDEELVVVMKSTVPVGTARWAEQYLVEAGAAPGRFPVASNPEFLREGTGVHDFLHPDRVVVGCGQEKHGLRVRELYRTLGCPVLLTDRESAEMIKYASNAFLAAKISFANEIAAICERAGADVTRVTRGMGLDRRIGDQFLQAGAGYGGSCFPKDTLALLHLARERGYRFRILEATVEVNQEQRRLPVRLTRDLLEGLEGRTVAVLGLAFKPGTDDVRDSPAVDVLRELNRAGAQVRAADPLVTGLDAWPELDCYCDPYEAARDADAVVMVTDWPQFRQLDLERLAGVMAGDALVDGRNAFSPGEARAAGLRYRGIGRPEPGESGVL